MQLLLLLSTNIRSKFQTVLKMEVAIWKPKFGRVYRAHGKIVNEIMKKKNSLDREKPKSIQLEIFVWIMADRKKKITQDMTAEGYRRS